MGVGSSRVEVIANGFGDFGMGVGELYIPGEASCSVGSGRCSFLSFCVYQIVYFKVRFQKSKFLRDLDKTSLLSLSLGVSRIKVPSSKAIGTSECMHRQIHKTHTKLECDPLYTILKFPCIIGKKRL